MGCRSRNVPGGTGGGRGSYEFVGRYRELWLLHSALHRQRFGLTQYASSGPLAMLIGIPGIGKSELAAAYAWHFGAAHLGGVYWISLAGSPADPAAVSARFVDALRSLLAQVGLDVGQAGPDHVRGMFAELVVAKAEPSLLVVDDFPGVALGDELAVPAGSRLHTVLVTDKAAFDGPATPIEIGPMTLTDSVEVLRRYRSGSDAEVEALATRLDGHPMALKLAGRQLRDLGGILSYPQFQQRLDGDATAMAPVRALLRDRIAMLDGAGKRALWLSLVCSPAAVPTVLLQRILGTDAEAAVTALRLGLIGTPADDAWQIHSLARDTAAELLPSAPSSTSLDTVAAETADAVLALLAASGLSPSTESRLVQHAGHLSARPGLGSAVVEALLRRVTEHYDDRGEAVLGMPFHVRLASLLPADSDVLAAASRCLLRSGEFTQAEEHGSRAVAVDPTPRNRQLLAEALDAQTRYAEADQLWADLNPHSIARCRALRLRGKHTDARRALEALIAELLAEPDRFHDLQAAQLELGRAEMETDAQSSARKRARAVMAAYEARGLHTHLHAVEAARLFADTRLSLAFWDLRTDPQVWRDAAEDLRTLRDTYNRTHGPRNHLTLSVAVAHAEALIALGKPGEARRAVEAVEADLTDRLPLLDPVLLRSQVVLGYAAAQCGHSEDATGHFRRAYEGQRDVLGPEHPHTLRSQLNLAINLKLTGHSAEANRIFHQVRRAAPSAVGRSTDLFGQAFVASVLGPLPTSLWRLLGNKPKPAADC